MNYRIGQLILSPASKNNTISEVFVAEPDIEKESLAGRLFILIEIETKRSEGLKLTNFLINHVNNSYYQNEKLVLKEKIPSLRIEHIFESVISRANKKIIEFIKEENIKISINSLNATIGLIYNNEIHFSTAGKNKALLIYKKISSTDKSYKTIDLAKTNKEEENNSDHKIFNNVISGSIPEGSVFVFSNEALPEYMSSKQLSDIITTLPPTSAVEQIKNTLSQINEYISFTAIIIKSSQLRLEETSKKIESNTKIEESIIKLNDTEQKTEEILSPAGNFKIKTYFKDLITKLLDNKKNQNKDNLFLRSGSKVNSRAIKFYLKKSVTYLNAFWVVLLNSIFYTLKSLGNAQRIKQAGLAFSSFFKNFFVSAKNNSFHLKRKYKIILLIFIISITGLFYSFNKIKNEKIVQEKLIEYQEKRSLIEQKQNQVEANLLYGNEEGAKNLIAEIKDLLSNFPNDTEEQISDLNDFNQKLSQYIDKVQKVIEIPEENLLVNFAEINSNSNIQNIILQNNRLYAGDPSQNSIYIYDLDQKLTTTITDLNNTLGNISLPVAVDEQNIYWLNGNQITKLNTASEEIFGLNFEKNPEANISAISSYNQRTYMLDKALSQIYRYERGDNGLLTYNNWLNKQTDLSEAISLDIDGFVYTLDSDGEIRKFLSGNEESFSQESIEPSLETANKIKVSKNNDFLYILDSTNSRIIVYRKDGQFIKQHSSKNLDNIIDFIVTDNDEQIYILFANKIYIIDANN